MLKTFGKPPKAASDDTMSWWIKNTISSTSIDMFKVHSTHSASSSKVKQVSIPYTEILKKGSWKSSITFTKHDKHIINKSNFADFDLLHLF